MNYKQPLLLPETTVKNIFSGSLMNSGVFTPLGFRDGKIVSFVSYTHESNFNVKSSSVSHKKISETLKLGNYGNLAFFLQTHSFTN